jgi:hypothetical protein
MQHEQYWPQDRRHWAEKQLDQPADPTLLSPTMRRLVLEERHRFGRVVRGPLEYAGGDIRGLWLQNL